MVNSLVTIILPVYNAEKYIHQTIKSVLSQNHDHWELLIINDGSTDQSKKIIGSFKDKRIKYFEQPNQGVSAARNIGLAHMSGDYFCFLDADDMMPRNSLSSRIKVFKENDNISFVDGVVKFINENGKSISGSYQPSFKGNPLEELLSLSGSCFFGPTWMIKRRPDAIYQFNENMTHSEDLAFYSSISADSLYSYTCDIILHYRKHDISAMSNLQGLETGYIQLIKFYIQTFPQFHSLKIRLKAAKIMFLSYMFDGKDPLNAFLSIFRILRA